ncbi:MAG: helix-turn-helix transcriptional regulator [Pseudomonadota bacterium]
MKKLSPQESRAARSALGISQAQVSTATGVSRSYISQFENEKLVLRDNDARLVADYYRSLGWIDDDSAERKSPVVPSPFKAVDGYVVAPSDVPYDEEALFELLRDSADALDAELNKPLPRGLLGGIALDDAMNAAACALAHAFAQVRLIGLLHGTWVPGDIQADLRDAESLSTVGDFLDALIANHVDGFKRTVSSGSTTT